MVKRSLIMTNDLGVWPEITVLLRHQLGTVIKWADAVHSCGINPLYDCRQLASQ